MLTAKYISNCLEDNIDEIKIAALYFDNIQIINNELYEVTPAKSDTPMKPGDIGIITGIKNFATEEFLSHISILEEEGIVEIIQEDDKREDELWDKIESVVNKILSENLNILFEEKDIERDSSGRKIRSRIKFSPEFLSVHSGLFGAIEKNSIINFEFMFKYYSSLLSSLFKNIAISQQCLTSSYVLNRFLRFYYQQKDIIDLHKELINIRPTNPQIAFEALKVAVPNISCFPMHEVLEARVKSKDELMRFREEMEVINFNMRTDFDEAFINVNAKDLVKNKIIPAVNELNKKIKALNLKLPKKVLDEFKNPTSYTPLIGTFFGAIPAHIATLLSLGIIGISTAYDYMISRKEIKDNGLYYLIDLQRRFS